MQPVYQKWALRMLLLAGLATVVVILLAYRFRDSRTDQLAPPAAKLPEDVNQQLSGYTFTRSDKGRPVLTMHAARTLNMKQDGSVMLEDVMLRLFGRRGERGDLLRTQHAEYDPRSGDFRTHGRVEIELNSRPVSASEPAAATPGS